MLTEWFQSDLIYIILIKICPPKIKTSMKGYIHTTQKNSNVINYPYVYISNLTVKWLFLKSFFMEKRVIYIPKYWLYDF